MRKNDFAAKGALNLPIIENIYNIHARQVKNSTGIFGLMYIFNSLIKC